jgi:hypothetical protein
MLGMENLDEEGKISLRQLVRSKIFKVFTLPYVQAAIALPTAFYVLTQIGFADAVQAVIYVVSINIVVHAITFAAMYGFMHKEVKIVVVWKSVAKYLLASLATAALLLFLPHTTTLTMTFGKVLLGAAVYVAILLAIDKDAKRLVKAIGIEIRGVLRPK